MRGDSPLGLRGAPGVVAQRRPPLPLCGGSSLLDAGGEAREARLMKDDSDPRANPRTNPPSPAIYAALRFLTFKT
jgi:hypothetical protein